MKYRGLSVFTGETVEVVVENGHIVSSGPSVEKTKTYVAPGFLDLQINGYAGIDYSGAELSASETARLCRLLASSGTLGHFPTIITNSTERILRNLAVIASARREDPFVRDAVSGIHVEGPFIAAEDGPRGAHDGAFVRKPDFEEFLRWQEAAEGLVKIVTLAPETEGALDFIEKVSRNGVIASIGHTAASPKLIRDAVSAGAKLSTHLGNGCHAQIPRLLNHLWEQMAADSISASIISDGFHLPQAVVKILARAKGLEKLILVSDVSFVAGREPGVYNWGNMKVELHPDGHIGLYGTPFLAGAGHLLDRCAAQFMNFTGAGVRETLRLCTINPARLVGLSEEAFSLAPGRPARLVFFDFEPGDEVLRIRKVLAGDAVFSAK